MTEQLNMFEGQRLRDKGIAQSLEKADRQIDKWSSKAYGFLLEYTKTNREFMAEDVRNASIGFIPQPKNGRAWGGVFVMAKKNGIIISKGFSSVKNP
ncbi:unnamed protein product, partial [marine sediment metagenome]